MQNMQNTQVDGYKVLMTEAERQKTKGEHEAAIKICEQIVCNDLDFAEAYEEIGDNYLSLKKYPEARKALERAVGLNPMSANANYLLGFVYSSLGMWKDSIFYLEKADKIEPNHPEILRCIGWSMFHDGHKNRGIILLERALTLKNDDVLILSDLGICYLNEKKFKRAGELFEKILHIEPSNLKAKECLSAVRFFQTEFKRIKTV
jgi:tetratricopeptide (TPR) repeat protein